MTSPTIWFDLIVRLFDDADTRRAMEDRIAARHTVRTPNETAAAIRTGLLQLVGAPAS